MLSSINTSIDEIYNSIQKTFTVHPFPIIFIDIDDTILTPKSLSVQNGLINQLKKDLDAKFYNEIISYWRVNRQILLLDKNWPQVINDLKKKFLVFGLTRMEWGKFGEIEQMEKHRFEELEKLNILFSQPNSNYPFFYKGIFFAPPNQHDKGEIIEMIKETLNIKKIVFIDDLQENLDDVAKVCAKYRIEYTPFAYKVKKIPADPDIMQLQYQLLVTKKKWLEDEEAIAYKKQLEKSI